MRSRPFLLLLTGFALVMLAVGEAEAKEPEWNFTVGSDVRSVAISADGQYIAAGSYDNKVHLFDKDSSTPLWNYTTGGWVYSVAISADGGYIAAGSEDGRVYLFNKDSSTPIWSYETGSSEAPEGVHSVAISADGEYIAAGSYDNKVYLFDKDSSTPLWSYDTGGWVYSVAISANGEYIAAGTDPSGDDLYLFGKDSSTPLWSYTAGGVHSVAISADGKYIAAGSGGWDKVYLFDKDSSTPLWDYTAGGLVESVAISADGEYIAAGSNGLENKVYLFDKDSGTPLWNYTTDDAVRSVAISADGEYIAAGSYIEVQGQGLDEKVYLFDKDSSTPLWNYTTGGWVYSVAISADGGYIAAGSEDGRVYFFNSKIPPTATIDSITPSPARFDANVTFSGTASDSDGTLVAYEWSSDIDGILSNEEDFSSIGFSVGTHNISFRVQDNDGSWSVEVTAELEIYPNVRPNVTIDSITPSPARFDADVTFSGTASDSDGNVVVYLWESSIDGELSTNEDFSTTGFSVGTHTITFRVQDNDGEWSAWVNTTLVIHPNAPPVGIIDSIEPSSAENGTTVFFNGTASDSDGNVVVYLWESSIDGELSTNEDFSTTSFSVGTHTITFRVQDNDGEWSAWVNTTLVIHPNAPPVGSIDSIEPSSAENGTTVFFTGTGSDSDGSIVAYRWESSIDGELSTEEDFSLTGNLSLGHHAITFLVQDNDGAWSSPQGSGENGSVPGISLWVYAVPISIAGDNVSTTTEVPIQFNGQGIDEDGSIAKYEWDFDGNGVYDWSSTENGLTTYIYNNEGTYTAVLKVTDDDGHTATDSLVITVSNEVEEKGDGFISNIAPLAAMGTVAVVAVVLMILAGMRLSKKREDDSEDLEKVAHVPEKSGLGSRILMGLIGILMSLVIAAVSFYHRFEILSVDLSEDYLVPIRDSMETLSTLLALVIVLALVTFICSILTFIGFGFSKKALLGSSTIMLVVLLACVWVEWSIIQTWFGDIPENTTNWRMNPLTMPPTLFAYCNLAGLAVMALIARLSRAKPESTHEEVQQSQEDDITEEVPISPSTVETFPLDSSAPPANASGEWRGGYEWVEHPAGSGEWYWRDAGTGEWVKH